MTEQQAARIEALLASHFKAGARRVLTNRPEDVRVWVGKWLFLIEFKERGEAGSVASAIKQLSSATRGDPGTLIPLVVVPRMGLSGRDVCEVAGVSWLDLDGNAEIASEDLFVSVRGRGRWGSRPHQTPTSNPFTLRNSRIVHLLLNEPNGRWDQQRILEATNLSRSTVSRTIKYLDQAEYIRWNAGINELTVINPRLLLEAWREARPLERHDLLKITVPARSGPVLLAETAHRFRDHGIEFAATGLAAAWEYTHFADFRITSIYVQEFPDGQRLWGRELAAEEPGANLWLVRPRDEGVFYGRTSPNDVPCVSIVQTYVDLVSHAERSAEASDEIRNRMLHWARTP